MAELTIFNIAIIGTFLIVLFLFMAPRKQAERGSTSINGGNYRTARKIEPGYCFNDCLRIHGDSKDAFCGVACGISGEHDAGQR